MTKITECLVTKLDRRWIMMTMLLMEGRGRSVNVCVVCGVRARGWSERLIGPFSLSRKIHNYIDKIKYKEKKAGKRNQILINGDVIWVFLNCRLLLLLLDPTSS